MAARLGRRGFLRDFGGGAAVLTAATLLPGAARATSAMGFEDARHLLSRTALGATPADILTTQTLDYTAAVDRLLARFRRQAATPAPAWVSEEIGRASCRER